MKTFFTLSLLFFYLLLKAQTGTLDSSFGIYGKVETNAGFQNYFYPAKALLQSDDKIIVTGAYQLTHNSDPLGFFAARYTSNGILDSTFGINGKKLISSEGYSVHATSAAIQKNNKILIAGYMWSWFPKKYIGIIIRLNANGTIDSSFGSDKDGILLQTKTTYFGALTVQPDNKFIAVSARNDSSFINRFLSNGTLDSTFGKNGFVAIDQYKSFFTCTLQPDGRFILSGYYYPSGFKKMCLQRFLSNGNIDKSFGTNGTVITKYNDDALIYDAALQPDKKIIATGETTIDSLNKTNFATVRYNNSGSIDSSFGINGFATTTFKVAARSNSVAIKKNGDIIIGGSVATLKHLAYAIVKLKSNGLPDRTFGIDGQLITPFNAPAMISTVLLQKDEQMIACGNSQNYYVPNITIARYNNDVNVTASNQKIKSNNVKINALNKVFIYPNPVKNILHIKGLLSSQKTKITVVDIAGNIKLQTVINTTLAYLNISALQQGNYLLKIEMNDEVITKQFIKQ